MDTIGQRIKKRREKAKVSQQYVADRVGVSRVAVTKWESGETSNLKLDNLMKLCKLLDMSVEYLIYGETKNESSAPLKFISKKQMDVNEINEDLLGPEMTNEDVTVIKSVVKGLKVGKTNKKEQTHKEDR